MSKEENFNKDIDLKKYNDSDGLSLNKLDFGLWLSENRKKIRQLLTLILIIFSVLIFSFSAYNYFIYFSSGDLNNLAVEGSVPISPRQAVSDLEVAPLQVFNGLESSDLAVKINNPNDKFMVSFKYCFTLDKQNLACDQNYLMPGEGKYILALGQALNGDAGQIVFNISDISWQRIDIHLIPNWNDYLGSHLNFQVTNLKLTPAQTSNLSQKIGLNILEFSIKNKTAYSYYKIPLNLLFFSGENLVGVHRFFLENFLTGEARDVKIVWTGNLPNVDQTQVQPDINLLDSGVYLPYGQANSH
ncbi:MAG: hypothetical protein WC249_01750 [Patescibacteria group bacterium]|jgi:hypothetical protein